MRLRQTAPTRKCINVVERMAKMQKLNHAKFRELYHDIFGVISESKWNGINAILDFLEADELITDLRWAAYMLATVKHETADTYRPIEEYGKGKGKAYGKIVAKTGQAYYGRGYVQLTWPDNYINMGIALNVDLYRHPENALKPDVAYKIMSLGMRQGRFTGVGLKKYIHDEVCDYLNARRIINGIDRAQTIAAYAEKFENILKGATL